MRILVSNDDGIRARGLKVIEDIAKQLSDDVWVVAPETEQSGAGHSLTLHRPVRVRRISARRLAVDGTPTDCVLLAINTLIPGPPPDLVLSGVNRGANVADDVTYSGTVAAAIEGTVLGIPSIALSQSFGKTARDEDELHDEDGPHWDCAQTHGPGVVKRLVETGWPQGVLMNVNFPARRADQVTRVTVTIQGQRDQSMLRVDERVDARGHTYFWIGFKRIFSDPPAGTDLRAMMEGEISVTPLHLDFTEMRERERLAKLRCSQ